MMSQTEKSKAVRGYYIEAEKSFINLRTRIMQSKDDRIKQLELNQKGYVLKRLTRNGVIYVIKAHPTMSLYKIGMTMWEYERMKSHNRALADDMEQVYRFETTCIKKVEACVKLMLRGRQYRKNKEVYEITLPKLQEIIKACDTACMAATDIPSQPSKMVGGKYYAVLMPMNR
jgi:hypothetical protein